MRGTLGRPGVCKLQEVTAVHSCGVGITEEGVSLKEPVLPLMKQMGAQSQGNFENLGKCDIICTIAQRQELPTYSPKEQN